MKILFITPEGFDTAGPNNQMAMVMISDFLSGGYDVHLIQSRRKKEYPQIPQRLEGRKGFTCDIIDRKDIDKSHLIVRYLDEVKYAFQGFRRWRKVRDADVVFVQSCPTVVWQLVLLKLIYRKPIVYNVYDVFPGHGKDVGMIKSSFIYKCFALLQKLAYALSDVTVVLSEDMKQKLASQGVKPEKIRIVFPWYDVETVREIPRDENRFIREYGIEPGKFYVQFAGSIGVVLDRQSILEAAQLLKNEKDIVFQIIGDGGARKKLEGELEQSGLENVRLYPWQPMDMIPDVYSAGSVCVIPLNKGVIGNGVPSKSPLLMACNRPIIALVEKDSHYYRLLNESGIGIAHDSNDYRAMAESILELYRNPEKISELTRRANEYARRELSSTVNTRKFMNIFDELGKKK
ncbi:MAG: glycosyltransferase family 4 protein [Clostridiales bacterium]|nr:glycosyltransferase family 4 protein [Clostridiales bacterium]